jgi:DNA-binding protein YbaB
MVKAEVSGEGELRSMVIDPSVVDPTDVELLQDMVVAAISEATRKRREAEDRIMGPIAGGLGIPGLS